MLSIVKSGRVVPLLVLAIVSLLPAACGTTEEPRPAPAESTAASAQAAAPAPVAMTAPSDAAVAPAMSEYWNPPTDYYGDPVYGGALRVNYEDPLEHANVWGAWSGVTVRYRTPVHNNLVETDPYDDGKIIPDLAAGWTNHDDGQGVTLYFHEGVKWHNGDAFTCEDARFTLETMVTGNGITASEMRGKLGFLDIGNSACLDDATLELRFAEPSATALLGFSDRAALIFNKAWFEANGEDAMFTDVSVGTGPFRWEEGQSVGVDEQNFVRNDDYFKNGLPYLDRVVIFGILDEAIQQSAMLAHQTDWHWVRNFGQYDAYVEHPQISTAIRATRGHHSLWLNARNAPFDNVRVRQAIMMGIDRDTGISILQDGHGSAGFLMAPGGPWSLDESQGCAVPGWCPPADGDWDARRAEAKAILEAEGFDFGKTYRFTVEADAQVQARATFFQEQLRLLGVRTDFDLVETIAYRKQTSGGSWGDILPRNDTMPSDDPALGLGYYFRCASPNNHWTPGLACDEKAEALLDQAATTVDRAQRKAISDDLQLYAMAQYWKFPLYWEQEAAAFWPEVRGYFHHPQPSTSFLRWEHIWIDPARADDAGKSGQTTGVPGGL